MAAISARLNRESGDDYPGVADLLVPRWGVARASVLGQGDRRLEADSYLSDGYGLRRAIETRPRGWRRFSEFATVLQPGRLKGIAVAPNRGMPFLTAGQVFEVRPRPRKWLPVEKIPDSDERVVAPGTILVSRSGNVGKVTVAHYPHMDKIITDDLLRVVPRRSEWAGWVYAYARTSSFRAMATGAHYGHVIKHLEVPHLANMPVVSAPDETVRRLADAFRKIFSKRDRAHAMVAEAEALYASVLGVDTSTIDLNKPFIVRSQQLVSGRRRLDAFHHNAVVATITDIHRSKALNIETLRDLTDGVWWPSRFARVFGQVGTPYVSADELFDTNPPIQKLIYAGLVENTEDYFLKPNWLVMVRSGQTYGLNGSVRLVGTRLARFFVSEDLIRIAPNRLKIRSGYLLCALSHPDLGRPLVIRNAYGTSIPHLEPEDVKGIPVARLGKRIEDEIADMMEGAAQLRADADDLEDQITEVASQVIGKFVRGDDSSVR